MTLPKFKVVDCENKSELFDFEKFARVKKFCYCHDKGLYTGYGFDITSKVNTTLNVKEIYRVEDRIFAYAEDKKLYHFCQNGFESVGIASYEKSPKIYCFENKGKATYYAFDGEYLTSIEGGEHFAITKGKNHKIINGVMFSTEENMVHFGRWEDVYLGHNESKVNSVAFGKEFGKTLYIAKGNEGAIVVLEKGVCQVIEEVSSGVIVKELARFSDRILENSITEKDGVIYFIKGNGLYSFTSSEKLLFQFEKQVESVSSCYAKENAYYFVQDNANYKRVCVIDMQLKENFSLSTCNHIFGTGGIVYDKKSNCICQVNKNASACAYYESQKIRLITKKEKWHIKEIIFQSQVGGLISISGDFGTKEQAIIEGENHLKLNLFSKYYTLAIYLEGKGGISQVKIIYTE